jgi:signal transduction histidine kinase
MRSLSSRLTIWYALSVTLTAAVFMLFGRYHLRESYIAGIDLLNDTEFGEILPKILTNQDKGNSAAAIDAIKGHTELDASLFFFQVGHDHEDTFFTSTNLGGHSLPKSVHQQRRITVEDEYLGTIRVGEYEAAGFDIHIASSLQGLVALENNLQRVAVLGLISIFLTSMGIGFAFSRYALKPISAIERTALLISAKNLSERIPLPKTEDEVSRLAILLNSMFDRLQSSFEQVQRFTADASHELKTPLSLIRINTEEMLGKLDSPKEERAQMLENQLDQIDALNKVINDLLILAKADAGSLKLSLSLQNCQDVLNDFAQDAKVLCEDKGLIFVLNNNYNGLVNFDLLWLRHLLFNLLANAIEASPDNGTISLSTKSKNEFCEIEILDEGAGIPEDKLLRVFERFFQESSNERGSGLGLSICRSIAQLHGGDLTLENRKSRSGIRVTISLPISD